MAAILFSHEWKKGRKDRNTNTDDKSLPEELHEDILVRLPVKPLVRFKSVCKRWQSLLQSPSFIHFHRRCHSRDHLDKILSTPYISIDIPRPTTSSSSSSSSLFIKVTDPKYLVLPPEISMTHLKLPYPEYYDLSNPECRRLARLLGPWRRVVRVLGPLNNGIYCMVANLQRGVHLPLRESVVTGKIALCNPAIRDYKFTNPFPSDLIPLLTDLARQPCRVHYGFGSVHKDGIGYDYKVVVIMSWGQDFSSFLSFVYSIRRGVWEKIADYESGERHLSKNKAVAGLTIRGELHYPEISTDLEMCPQRFFNGSWHWMAVGRDNYKYIVLSFHMANEAFKFIGGPPGYVKGIHDNDSKYIKGGVLVLNDHLAAIYFTARASSCRDSNIDVWMMMEYGVEDSWTKIYAIEPTCSAILTFVGISSSLRDDCIGGIHIQKIIFQDCHKKLISCDDSGVEDHGVYDLSSSIYWNTLGISAYSETLEPLNIAVEDRQIRIRKKSIHGRNL